MSAYSLFCNQSQRRLNAAALPFSSPSLLLSKEHLFTLNSDLHLIIENGNNISEMAGTLSLLVFFLTLAAIFNEQSKMTAVAPNPFENVILRVLSKPVGI